MSDSLILSCLKCWDCHGVKMATTVILCSVTCAQLCTIVLCATGLFGGSLGERDSLLWVREIQERCGWLSIIFQKAVVLQYILLFNEIMFTLKECGPLAWLKFYTSLWKSMVQIYKIIVRENALVLYCELLLKRFGIIVYYTSRKPITFGIKSGRLPQQP